MDHDGIRQMIAAFVLDALDPDERGRVDRELLEHLPGCDECLALMRDLREVGGELALGAGAAAVSPTLEASRGFARSGPPHRSHAVAAMCYEGSWLRRSLRSSRRWDSTPR
jgi:anti-sigma factor RsiW